MIILYGSYARKKSVYNDKRQELVLRQHTQMIMMYK